MATYIDERKLRDAVRNYIDPIITKLHERIYGSGNAYNTTIAKVVLPPDTTYDADVDGLATAAGFIKGISTYIATTLLGSNQKQISISGVGSIGVTGSVASTKTSYVISGASIPITAKGDILTRSATVVDRLAVGLDGTVLTADSSQPLGLKWAVASGSSTPSGIISFSQITTIMKVDSNYGVTKDGSDLVSEWADQGFYSVNPVQSSASLQPLWVNSVINGYPVIRFDGSNDYLAVAYVAAAVPRVTVILVVQPKATETARGIFAWADNSPTSGTPFVLFQRDSTNIKIYVGGAYQWTIAHASNATKLYYLQGDGITWKLWVDGTAQSDATAGFNNQSVAAKIFIGSGFNGASNSDVAYVEVRNALLSSTDRTALIDSLKTQYGL
jgi:hypothetical protein